MAKVDLTRVVFEYSDGTTKYIDNENLEKWLSFNAIVASIAQIHNTNPPWDTIKWMKTDKLKHY